jgi:hypothetical protein
MEIAAEVRRVRPNQALQRSVQERRRYAPQYRGHSVIDNR